MNSIDSWQESKIGEHLELLYGKSLPKRNRKKGEYAVYGSSGVVDHHDNYLVKGPGIVIGRKGNVGSVFYSKNNFFPIDTTYYVKFKRKNDLLFWYYYLLVRGLENYNTHAAVPGLNRDVVYNLECKIPEIAIQRKISGFTSQFDNLIEINLNRIKILRELPLSLHNEWFDRLKFPGHEDIEINQTEHGPTPKGWEWTKFGEVIELAYGKALKKTDRIPGEFPVYGSSGIIGHHEHFLVEGPTIIVGRKGNVGSIFWSAENCYPIDTVFYVKSNISLYYLYFNLQTQNFINSDAAVPGLSRNQAYTLPILIPSTEILTKYEKIIVSFFQEIQILSQKNEKLGEMRDHVLAKLISGEIDISGINITL